MTNPYTTNFFENQNMVFGDKAADFHTRKILEGGSNSNYH